MVVDLDLEDRFELSVLSFAIHGFLSSLSSSSGCRLSKWFASTRIQRNLILRHFRRIREAVCGQGLIPEHDQRNQPPRQAHDHAAVDNPPPRLGQEPDQENKDDDPCGHGQRSDLPLSLCMEIGHAKKRREYRMKQCRMVPEMPRARCHAGRKALLKRPIALNVGHEKKDPEKGSPVIPQPRFRKSIHCQRCQPEHRAADQEYDPCHSPQCPEPPCHNENTFLKEYGPKKRQFVAEWPRGVPR